MREHTRRCLTAAFTTAAGVRRISNAFRTHLGPADAAPTRWPKVRWTRERRGAVCPAITVAPQPTRVHCRTTACSRH
jgi:hypothetical protein